MTPGSLANPLRVIHPAYPDYATESVPSCSLSFPHPIYGRPRRFGSGAVHPEASPLPGYAARCTKAGTFNWSNGETFYRGSGPFPAPGSPHAGRNNNIHDSMCFQPSQA